MLIALSILLPIWFGYRRSRVSGGFEVNHVTLFSFGFLFYWVLPIAAAPIAAEAAGSSWSSLFDGAGQITFYFGAVLLSYVAFMLGDLIGKRAFPRRPGFSRPLHRSVLSLALVPILGSILLSSVLYRSLLFQPYGVNVEIERAKGAIAANVVMLGSISLLYLSDNVGRGLRRHLQSRFVWPFVLGCLYLLVLGTRLYVISFVLMFCVYRSCYVRPLAFKTIVLGGTFAGLLSGLIGIFRVGESWTNVFTNLLLEPMFTSFSLIYFLSYNRIRWLAFPKYLLSDFSNLIPSAVFPGKANLTQFPYVYTPLGALHSFVSFNFNLGILGTACFMVCLPIVLRWVMSRQASQLGRVSYAMLSGCLAFTFFRDPFSVSIVKMMLEFSIIIPGILVGLSRAVQNRVPLGRSFRVDHPLQTDPWS